ncbi:integrase core domain-containing protein [Streptomyces pratens]|uniref:Integrase core domain-containing protein n=1 Tax=Streptomyces pratens TaxID=887456 RepID=A0ABW1M2J4_9ACTN
MSSSSSSLRTPVTAFPVLGGRHDVTGADRGSRRGEYTIGPQDPNHCPGRARRPGRAGSTSPSSWMRTRVGSWAGRPPSTRAPTCRWTRWRWPCGGRRSRRTPASFVQVERAVFQWVAWYNGERLHSAMGYVPPDEYEQAYWASLEEAPQTA